MAESDPLVVLFAGQFEVRGSCAYTLRLLERLPSVGISARMTCSSAAQVPDHSRSLPIEEFPMLGIPLLSKISVRQIARRIAPLNPSLIHIQARKVVGSGIQLANLLQLPYILTVHDIPNAGETLDHHPTWGRDIIAVSDAVRRGLVEVAGVNYDLIQVIPSGVEVPAEVPKLFAHDTPVIGTAGPLELMKGHRYFLESARNVIKLGFDAEFLIAGAGAEEAHLRKIAVDLGIGTRVTFAPHVREYTSVLQAMDLFVLPSIQQGLGTVMIEAMAHAKPVIASGVGGVSSVVKHKENGLIIHGGDTKALSEAIAYLLENKELARQMGAAARRMVKSDYSVETMTKKTADLMFKHMQQA